VERIPCIQFGIFDSEQSGGRRKLSCAAHIAIVCLGRKPLLNIEPFQPASRSRHQIAILKHADAPQAESRERGDSCDCERRIWNFAFLPSGSRYIWPCE